MNFEEIMLSEGNQSQKDEYCIMRLHEVYKIGEHSKKSRNGSGQELGGGEVGNCYSVGIIFSFTK